MMPDGVYIRHVTSVVEVGGRKTVSCTCRGTLVEGASTEGASAVEASHLHRALNPSVSPRDASWRAVPPSPDHTDWWRGFFFGTILGWFLTND